MRKYYEIKLRRASTNSLITSSFKGGASHFNNELLIIAKFRELVHAGWSIQVIETDEKHYKILRRREACLAD